MFNVFNWFYERSDFSLDAFDAIHRLQCRVRTTKEMCEKNKKNEAKRDREGKEREQRSRECPKAEGRAMGNRKREEGPTLIDLSIARLDKMNTDINYNMTKKLFY